jgi:hypothetical protein
MRHCHQEPIEYPEPALLERTIIKVEIEKMTGKASI